MRVEYLDYCLQKNMPFLNIIFTIYLLYFIVTVVENEELLFVFKSYPNKSDHVVYFSFTCFYVPR